MTTTLRSLLRLVGMAAALLLFLAGALPAQTGELTVVPNILSWTGLLALLGLAAQWGASRHQQQRTDRDVRALAEQVRSAIPRPEAMAAMERIEDRLDERLDRIEQKIDQIIREGQG